MEVGTSLLLLVPSVLAHDQVVRFRIDPHEYSRLLQVFIEGQSRVFARQIGRLIALEEFMADKPTCFDTLEVLSLLDDLFLQSM